MRLIPRNVFLGWHPKATILCKFASLMSTHTEASNLTANPFPYQPKQCTSAKGTYAASYSGGGGGGGGTRQPGRSKKNIYLPVNGSPWTYKVGGVSGVVLGWGKDALCITV